jgi:hypothetical protein
LSPAIKLRVTDGIFAENGKSPRLVVGVSFGTIKRKSNERDAKPTHPLPEEVPGVLE